MPYTVNMPKLSPTMTEGTVAKWHKKEGDFVEPGELLLEIATDKATIEHNALDEGWLRKILVKEGAMAQVNAPVALFSLTKDENIEDFKIEKAAPPEESMPKEKMTSLKEPEQPTKTISEPLFAPSPPLENYSFNFPSEALQDRIPASPLAKKLAKEKNLDLSTVKGSGPGGRVTSHDLDKAQPSGAVTFGRREQPQDAPGSYEEIPLSPIRKIIAKRLQESKSFIPHFYVTQEIDAEPMIVLREQLKNVDLKVTFNDFIIRASALALRQHPRINSGFHSGNQTIIRYKTIDISIAVTFEEGLITPIIRHADYKNIGQLSVEMRSLAEKAKQGKLAEHEYKGGSFCISNLGMYGISSFVAVINPPQGAILAVGGIEDKAIVKNGQIVAGKRLTLTLSADHRVIDGAEAAQFLKTLQHFLENPVSLTI